MPQLRLEYTANIIEKNNFSVLFAQCHDILAEQLPTDLASCKSRAVEQQNYYVGDGHANNAFVSLRLQVMAGRSPETLDKVAQSLLALLKTHFAESLTQLTLQITLELQELSRDIYFKIT